VAELGTTGSYARGGFGGVVVEVVMTVVTGCTVCRFFNGVTDCVIFIVIVEGAALRLRMCRCRHRIILRHRNGDGAIFHRGTNHSKSGRRTGVFLVVFQLVTGN